MKDSQQIKRLLVKVLKSLPFLLMFLFLTILLVKKYLSYKNPLFESVAKIKLDKTTYGISAANLYKNFDVFSSNEDIKAEVELIQSQVIVSEALDNMDWDVTYYRVGEIRTSDIYHESPFMVEYDTLHSSLYNKRFDVIIKTRKNFELFYQDQKGIHRFSGTFNTWIETDSMRIRLVPDPIYFNKPDKVVFDHYQFQVNTKPALVKLVQSHLKVKEADEHVPVILIIYRDESPKRAAKMVNAIAEAYINDYIHYKTGVARKSLEFIRTRIDTAYHRLLRSEQKLVEFKKRFKVVNTRQETETGLREISKIKVQLENLEIQQAALDTLNKYINQKEKNFWDYIPKNSFGDLLYTELIKKLKQYQSEREDLLLTYTENDDRVQAVDRKMHDLIDYIKKSIKSTAEDLAIRKAHLQKVYDESTKMFDNLPEREKIYVYLNREFQINQEIYVFLKKKEIEASTQSAARMSFHRIISRGSVPKEPVFPNHTLILMVSGLLSLIVGAILLYLKDYLFAVIKNRTIIEENSSLPVAALVPKIKKSFENKRREDIFNNLANTLIFKSIIPQKGLVAVTSSIKNEGKSYLSSELAKSLARKGIQTCLVDFNLHQPVLHKLFGVSEGAGIEELVFGTKNLEAVVFETQYQNLSIIQAGYPHHIPSEVIGHPEIDRTFRMIKEAFDVVIVDTPASTFAADAVKLMQLSEATLYVIRAHYTRELYLMNADFLKDEYHIEHMAIILNDVPLSFNYNGLFFGSRYKYEKRRKNLIGVIKNYKESYL